MKTRGRGQCTQSGADTGSLGLVLVTKVKPEPNGTECGSEPFLSLVIQVVISVTEYRDSGPWGEPIGPSQVTFLNLRGHTSVTWAPLGPPWGPALCLAKGWLQLSRFLWSASKSPDTLLPIIKTAAQLQACSVGTIPLPPGGSPMGRQSPWEPMPDFHDWVMSHTQPGEWITCRCNKSEVVFTHVCMRTTWERKENRRAHLGELGEGRCWTTWNNSNVQAFTSHHTVMVQRLEESESNLKAK